MKNLLKSMMIIVLSLVLCLGFAGSVFADEITTGTSGTTGATSTTNSSTLDWDNAVYANSVTTNTTNTNNTITSANTTNTNTNTNRISNTNTNTNTNSKATNELAYTGSESINGIIAVAVVLGAFVAIYSFRKVQDYKNIK